MKSCSRDQSPTNILPTHLGGLRHHSFRRISENSARHKRIGTPANTLLFEKLIGDPAFYRTKQKPTHRSPMATASGFLLPRPVPRLHGDCRKISQRSARLDSAGAATG